MVWARPRSRRLYSGWLKPPKALLVPFTEHQWHPWSEMSALSPKDTKRRHPTQPQSVHPAAIWKKILNNPLTYHQTTEQLPHHQHFSYECSRDSNLAWLLKKNCCKNVSIFTMFPILLHNIILIWNKCWLFLFSRLLYSEVTWFSELNHVHITDDYVSYLLC